LNNWPILVFTQKQNFKELTNFGSLKIKNCKKPTDPKDLED
jgi:hypothetical protein